MAVFDDLLAEVNNKLNLNGKAQTLLSELLTLITSERRGGFSGFLDLFRRVGMGAVADSWVSGGANTPLANQQLEDALGVDTLGEIASRVGIAPRAATSALAYMIPLVVDALTPNGNVPDARALLSDVGGNLSEERISPGNTSIGKRTMAGENQPAEFAAQSTLTTSADRSESNSLLRSILPLLLLGILVFLGLRFCGAANQNAALVNVNQIVNTNVNRSSQSPARSDAATNLNSNVLP